MDTDVDTLIDGMLAEAVPNLIAELAALTVVERRQTMCRWRDMAAPIVQAHGDGVRFGSARNGDVAHVFGALARSLATLAHTPGGVTFAGRHWCANHRLCVEAAAEADRIIAAETTQAVAA